METLEKTKQRLEERSKTAEDMTYKASGAEEALENMRRDIQDIVSNEVEERQTKFDRVEDELVETK